jgi:hypothetical protein
MAKTSQLNALDTLAQDDLIQVVDVSDTITMTGGGGTNKKITLATLSTGLTSLGTLQPLIPTGTSSQYYRGDKQWATLNKAAVELSNVTNESKATMFTNPTFTGTVTLPSTTSIGDISNVELGYLTGVTSNIQTQLDDKLSSSVSSTELGYLIGVTSSIQTQLDSKQGTITGGGSTITSTNLTSSRALVSDSSGKVAVSNVTGTELGRLVGVTSSIQAQLDGKANNSVVATGSTTSRSLANRFADVINVKDFGAVGDGVTDDTAAIQAAINSVRDGIVLVPNGEYVVNGNIVFLIKGQNPTKGGFKLEATGAFFTGTGKLIIDSCKRLQINGLDMANIDLAMRGCWWSQIRNTRFRKLHINDATGTNFSSNYWNNFQQCQFQSVLIDSASTSPSNEFSFDSCSMRGNIGQGFLGTAAYAFEFNASQNCQSWKFNNGDISYHSTSVYNIGAGNTSGDIEISFNGVYFDSVLPISTDREKTRIRQVNCHHANGSVGIGSFSAMTCQTLDQFRSDRAFKHDGWTGVNLVPNGDFKDRLNIWVGSGLPIGSASGATVTRQSGGFFGNYLNLNQTATTLNGVRFRSKPLPMPGRLTATIVLRNADAGSKTITLQTPGPLNPTVVISDSEWTIATITNNTIFNTDTTQDLQVYTNDNTAYNVDVAYVAITLGEGSPLVIESTGFPVIQHTEIWNAPDIANNSQVTQVFTVNGAEYGDFVIASFSGTVGGLDVSSSVSNNNEVTLKLKNDSGSNINLSSGEWRFRVFKSKYL